ncbi:hypothetical protein NPIL_473011 [Nephila pilipes]|uniref:Uncharacterized protein n=1 Tax=Nephila pilipes TaxID=299642 RepID=A0A8X6QZG5_NEPPI|nr:hypothetical protein NPIL_473011 [Nephila pilipes]
MECNWYYSAAAAAQARLGAGAQKRTGLGGRNGVPALEQEQLEQRLVLIRQWRLEGAGAGAGAGAGGAGGLGGYGGGARLPPLATAAPWQLEQVVQSYGGSAGWEEEQVPRSCQGAGVQDRWCRWIWRRCWIRRRRVLVEELEGRLAG